MNYNSNVNDDIKILKLRVLKDNMKQNWNLDTDVWNEEFPHDYRFEDTYLQLSFILRHFNIDELKHLILITDVFDIKNYNHTISILINNYIKSCVDYLNFEIEGKSEEYFKKFNKDNNCFSYEGKIKNALKKQKVHYSLFFYGTLRALEVREAVLGKDVCEHITHTGYLNRYKVYGVRGANFPLIKFTNNIADKTEGLLIYNITYEDLLKLDKFEGINYFRDSVKINVDQELYDSQVYMPNESIVSDGLWDYKNWYKYDMQKFFKNDFDVNGVNTIK